MIVKRAKETEHRDGSKPVSAIYIALRESMEKEKSF